MAPAFSKEAILQGTIDHLCLVCETYLRSEREMGDHVSTPAHRQNLDTTAYVEKYRNDRVRKVKKWYYCEFCNVLVSTNTAVGLHVQDPKHMESKSLQMIRREDDHIVSGNVVIQGEAWHGLIDENTCAICNVEYDDRDRHTSGPSHIINLIQSKASDLNNNVYRKIDNSTFHCLTCNEVVAEIKAHLDTPEHKKLLQQSANTIPSKSKKDQENMKPLEPGDQNSKPNTKSVEENSERASDILDSISKFQKNNININFESCTAVCKRCSVSLEFNCKEIESHIEQHERKNNVEKKATGSALSLFTKDDKNNTSASGILFMSPVFKSEGGNKEYVETEQPKTTKQNGGNNSIEETAEKYGLTYISADKKVYCQLCNKDIDPSIMKMNKHVSGELHKSKLPKNFKDGEVAKKNNAKKCNLVRVPSYGFVIMVNRIKGILSEDVVVNDKYCIDMLSFFFLKIINRRQIRCQVCEVNMPVQDINEHQNSVKHKRAMIEVPVIIHLDSTEFIREIRSEIFHCGYCNIYDTWEGMENHLKSTDHKRCKARANMRLSQYLPRIAQDRRERDMEKDFIIRFLFSLITD